MRDTSKLRSVVESYAYKHGVDAIPYEYYDRMVDAWNCINDYGRENLKGDRYKVAAAVLFAAHMDGYIHEAQITPKGLQAMKCAGKFLQETDIMPEGHLY